jgi:hypothetical protein
VSSSRPTSKPKVFSATSTSPAPATAAVGTADVDRPGKLSCGADQELDTSLGRGVARSREAATNLGTLTHNIAVDVVDHDHRAWAASIRVLHHQSYGRRR